MPANIQLALVVNLKFREFLLLLELYKEGSFSFKTIVRTNQHYRSKLITLDFFYFGGGLFTIYFEFHWWYKRYTLGSNINLNM